MAEALRTPRGSDGACLFLKSGSACRRLGSSEATQGGGPRRKEGALLGPEAERELGKCCCSAGSRGLQAVRPARGIPGGGAGGGCSSARAGPPAANFCGLRGGGSGCVGRRSPPPPDPHRAPAACVCSSAPSCLCSYAARSRPAHPGAAPAGKPSLVSLPRGPAAGDRGCCSCARARNVVTAGTRCRAEPGRRDERLASRENLEIGSPFSFQRVGRWVGVGTLRGQTCGGSAGDGGRELGPVLERPRLEC